MTRRCALAALTIFTWSFFAAPASAGPVALSFKHGAMDLIGPWKDLGRWKRHLYEGMADAIERKHNFEAGALLETPWQDLPAEVRNDVLYGTGELHITYSWRHGGGMHGHGE